jgi:DNA-binding NtrC family response regulator
MKHQILLVTSQAPLLAPIAAVLKSILGHGSVVIEPDAVLALIAKTPQDMVIVDMHHQGKSLDLVRQIKLQFPTTPVVAMVPYGDVAMIDLAISHGADDYISQPIALERLKVSLRNALRLRVLLQRAYQHAADGLAQEYAQNDTRLSYWVTDDGIPRTLQEMEAMAIEHAVNHCNGCITQAARALGIGRSTLYRKMQEMDVRQSSYKLRDSQTTRPTTFDSSMDAS